MTTISVVHRVHQVVERSLGNVGPCLLYGLTELRSCCSVWAYVLDLSVELFRVQIRAGGSDMILQKERCCTPGGMRAGVILPERVVSVPGESVTIWCLMSTLVHVALPTAWSNILKTAGPT